MKATTSCSWVVTLSLMSMLSTLAVSIPVHSQSAASSGSLESHTGGTQKIPIPAKPRSSQPDGAMRNSRPSDIPDQIPAPNVRALEERIRRGEMERPIAQAEISDRLEQLHSGSAGHSTNETTPRAVGPGE